MRRMMVAGNWKMNKTNAEAVALVEAMIPGLEAIQSVDNVVFPAFTALAPVSELLKGTSIGCGAQNLYWEESGAYTGEISPLMIKQLCNYVIIGHSERRQYFGETNETVNKKIKAALAHKLTPIVCIGETLEENRAGKTTEKIQRQINEGFSGLSAAEMKQVIIAYEPIWAIGTGVTATPEEANRIHGEVIRPVLKEMFGGDVDETVRILYGGSVKAKNAKEIFAQPDIDGGLVGGASLKADEFIKITEAAA